MIEYEIIAQLIQNGDLDKLRETASQYGADSVKINGIEEDFAGIHLAAGKGDIELVRFFLEEPISENPNITRGNNFSPLHSSAMFGYTDVVKLLLESGADANVQTEPQKYAPIHSASFGGHLETIKVLVAHAANIELKNYRGESPIDTARRQGQSHVVAYFEKLMKEKHLG